MPDFLIRQAYAARRSGDKRGALGLYLEAAQRMNADGGGDSEALASALRHAADLQVELGDSDAAWSNYLRARQLYEDMSSAPALAFANCLRPMALWQEAYGTSDAALNLWHQAQRFYQQADAESDLDLQPAFVECARHIHRLEGGD